MGIETILELYYDLMGIFATENPSVPLKPINKADDTAVLSEAFKTNSLNFAKDLPLMRLSITKGKKVTYDDIYNTCQDPQKEQIEVKLNTAIVSHVIKSKLISEQLSGSAVDNEIEKLLNTIMKGDIRSILNDKSTLDPVFRLLSGDKVLLNKLNSTFKLQLTQEDIIKALETAIHMIVTIYAKSPKKIIPVSGLYDNIGTFVDYIVNDERFPEVFATTRSNKIQLLSRQPNYTEEETLETVKQYIRIVANVLGSSEVKRFTKIEFKMALKLITFKVLNMFKIYKVIEEDIKKKQDSELYACIKDTVLTKLPFDEDSAMGAFTEVKNLVVEKVPDFLEKNPEVKQIIDGDQDTVTKAKRLLGLFLVDANIERYFKEEFGIDNYDHYKGYIRNILGIINAIPKKAFKKVKTIVAKR